MNTWDKMIETKQNELVEKKNSKQKYSVRYGQKYFIILVKILSIIFIGASSHIWDRKLSILRTIALNYHIFVGPGILKCNISISGIEI